MRQELRRGEGKKYLVEREKIHYDESLKKDIFSVEKPGNPGDGIRQECERMGVIKSALEIALEQEAPESADPDILVRKKIREDGQRGAAGFFGNADEEQDDHKKNLLKTRETLSEKERLWFKEGMFRVFAAHLRFPPSGEGAEFRPFYELIPFLVPEDSLGEAEELLDRLDLLFREFTEEKTRVVEQIREQYEPVLRQKEARIRQETGRNIRLKPEDDPEFSKQFKGYLEQFQKQYEPAFKQLKEGLTALAGVHEEDF